MFKKALLLLFFIAPVNAGTKSNAAIEAYNQAVKAINARQFEHGSDDASRAISIDSQFAEAYYLRAVCRYSLKAAENASIDLSDALRIDPGMTDARALRAVIFYEADQYDSALEDLNLVLSQKPEDAQSLLIRGIIHMKREEKSGAIQDLKAFLRLRPQDPLAPRLKEALAAMGSGSGTQTAERSSSPSPRRSDPSSSRPGVAQARVPGQISTRELADKFGQQLLRGNAGPVSGDIDKRKTIETEAR